MQSVTSKRFDFLSLGVAVACGLLVLAVHWPMLGLYFDEIDDAGHVYGAMQHEYMSPRFRPVHHAWNVALYRLFGADPLAFRLAGSSLHVMSAWLLFSLVRRLTREAAPAIVAAFAFTLLYSPHEVRIWFAASTGLLAIMFMLLAARSYAEFLLEGRWRWYLLTICAFTLALGSKEIGVVALPLLLMVDLRRRTRLRGTLLRSIPFLVVLTIYLGIAYRPEIWASRPGGRYEASFDLVPKVLRNFAWLFWPGISPDAPRAGASIGALLVLATAILAWRNRSWLLAAGLLVALAGLLPAAPGRFEMAGTRYAYASSIGAALLIAGAHRVVSSMRCWPGSAGIILVSVGGGVFLAAHAMAARSVEGWRYRNRCTRMERLMTSTREEVLAVTRRGTPAVVVAPAIWNPQDYGFGVVAFLGRPRDGQELEFVPWRNNAVDLLGPGAPLDLGRDTVFTTREDGAIVRLRTPEEVPLARWESSARSNEELGNQRMLAVFRFASDAP